MVGQDEKRLVQLDGLVAVLRTRTCHQDDSRERTVARRQGERAGQLDLGGRIVERKIFFAIRIRFLGVLGPAELGHLHDTHQGQRQGQPALFPAPVERTAVAGQLSLVAALEIGHFDSELVVGERHFSAGQVPEAALDDIGRGRQGAVGLGRDPERHQGFKRSALEWPLPNSKGDSGRSVVFS